MASCLKAVDSDFYEKAVVPVARDLVSRIVTWQPANYPGVCIIFSATENVVAESQSRISLPEYPLMM